MKQQEVITQLRQSQGGTSQSQSMDIGFTQARIDFSSLSVGAAVDLGANPFSTEEV